MSLPVSLSRLSADSGGAGHDLAQLLGDDCLARLVHVEGDLSDHLAAVLGRVLHCTHARRHLRGRALKQPRVHLGGKNELHHVVHVEGLGELVLELVLLSEGRHPLLHGIRRLALVDHGVVGDCRPEPVVDDVGLVVLLASLQLLGDLRGQREARRVLVDLRDDAREKMAMCSLQQTLALAAKDGKCFLALEILFEDLGRLDHLGIHATAQTTVRGDGHNQMRHVGACERKFSRVRNQESGTYCLCSFILTVT